MKHLPRDSAYVRSLQGDLAYWHENTELLAQIVDAVERLSFYFRTANFTDAGSPPSPVLRPGQTPPQLPTVSLAEWASTL